MKIKKIIGSSLATIALAASLASGATYALFTSSAETNIVIGSGRVKVSAEIRDFKMSSGKWDGIDYVSEDLTASMTFANGGTASLKDNKLELVNLTPMDKVEFKIVLTNHSNVKINYRTLVETVSDTGLFPGLKIKIDNVDFTTRQIGPWTEMSGSTTDQAIKTFDVSVELPLGSGNTYQECATSLRFAIEALQGNAKLEGSFVENTEVVVNDSTQDVVLQTNNVSVEVASGAIDNLIDGDKIELTALISDSTVEDQLMSVDLSLIHEDKPVESFAQPITITLPVPDSLTDVAVVYNGQGDQPTNVSHVGGQLSFTTEHFSEFVIFHNMPNYKAVSTVQELQDAANNVNIENIIVVKGSYDTAELGTQGTPQVALGVRINRSLRLLGTNKDQVHLYSSIHGNMISVALASTTFEEDLIITNINFKPFSGPKITTGSWHSTGISSIYVDKANFAEGKSVIITDCDFIGDPAETPEPELFLGYAIQSTYSNPGQKSFVIKNCYFANLIHAIYLNRAASVLIENNTFEHIKNGAIVMDLVGNGEGSVILKDIFMTEISWGGEYRDFGSRHAISFINEKTKVPYVFEGKLEVTYSSRANENVKTPYFDNFKGTN